jgi:penicillin-binding protein 2
MSHIEGVDFAGKTGTAQTISNAAKAKLANGKSRFRDNAWFVGVEPRRNPEIVVCVLMEAGDEGYLAARVAAQVVKFYAEKQRRQPTNVANGKPANGKVEVGALWTSQDENGSADKLNGGKFELDLSKHALPLATAAPGLN